VTKGGVTKSRWILWEDGKPVKLPRVSRKKQRRAFLDRMSLLDSTKEREAASTSKPEETTVACKVEDDDSGAVALIAQSQEGSQGHNGSLTSAK